MQKCDYCLGFAEMVDDPEYCECYLISSEEELSRRFSLKENIMQWKKQKHDTGVEYSASSGPVTFWIFDNDGDFNTVIHYGGHTETAVLPSESEAKDYCKNKAIDLLKETLTKVKALESNHE